jgi:lipopolysaccharide export system permease protein
LQRYVWRQLLGPFAFFTLALTGVIWLSQSLRFIDWIFNKGLSAGFFFYMTALLLPGLLAIVLPIALFAAVIYAYHRMSAESEIVVMSAAGIGPWPLARPALLLAVLVTGLGYALTLYLMPLGQRNFRMLRMDLKSDLSHVLLQEGTFNTVTGGLTVYIRERRGSGEMRGILVHDSRNQSRPTTMMAEQGVLVRTKTGPRLVLVNGNRQEIAARSHQLSILHFDRYALDLGQFVQATKRRWFDAKARYLHELFRPGDSPADRRNAARFRAAGNDRITAPLFALAFALMGLAAVLGGQFSRRGLGLRVAVVVGAAIVVRLAGLATVNLAAKTPVLIPLIYLNIAAAIAVSLYLLWRPPGLGRRGLATWWAG